MRSVVPSRVASFASCAPAGSVRVDRAAVLDLHVADRRHAEPELADPRVQLVATRQLRELAASAYSPCAASQVLYSALSLPSIQRYGSGDARARTRDRRRRRCARPAVRPAAAVATGAAAAPRRASAIDATCDRSSRRAARSDSRWRARAQDRARASRHERKNDASRREHTLVLRPMAVAKLGVVYTPREVTAPMVERALAPLVAGKSPATDPRAPDLRSRDRRGRVPRRDRALSRRRARRPRCRARWSPRAASTASTSIPPRSRRPARRSRRSSARRSRRSRTTSGSATRSRSTGRGSTPCVGNPPYIRQEKLSPATKHALRAFASYDGVADLYVYFIELAHRLARAGGRYCLSCRRSG